VRKKGCEFFVKLQRMTENLKKAGSEDSADRDQDDGSQSSGEELAAVIIKQEMEMRAKDREIALLQRVSIQLK
jgi:hypothetical protein